MPSVPRLHQNGKEFADELRAFREFGAETIERRCRFEISGVGARDVPVFVNEFWTSGQRQAHSLHEISYRACFKPQLPRFFIERLTKPGELVYDPFMGRGTTLLEGALLGRNVAGNDVNPLSAMLLRPRLNPPALNEIQARLKKIPFGASAQIPEELLVFYHPETLKEIVVLKEYLLQREKEKKFDPVDAWIRMIAINRLTGHSPGFFSVYTLPPNQAVSIKSQIKINERRKQTPPRRNVAELIVKKSRKLLIAVDREMQERLRRHGERMILSNSHAAETRELPGGSVSLVVTSPPFLDVVDYAGDNWLRCWFAGVDPKGVCLTVPKKIEVWEEEMTRVFIELKRVLRGGGHIAFEVGEVKKGEVKLEEAVLGCGTAAGLTPELVLINEQEFTKTANCWGVDNNSKGTNSNRIVLFRKE